jgi:HAD superfamily hydrolase (TIGR01509 family)
VHTLDHDGVLVDTEFWYYKAGERALADIGLTLDKDQYLRDMNQGLGTWAQARAAGIDEQTISRQREVRNDYYQEYLRTEAIEIEGVVETLAELSKYVRMAIVTTAKRVDFEIIHEKRQIRQFMDFVLVREDYNLTKPHPEPYLTGLKRFGATKEETLVVEDSSRGLNSAVAAGIDCVIVYNDFTKAHDFSQASYRIETLIELKDIILNVTWRRRRGVGAGPSRYWVGCGVRRTVAGKAPPAPPSTGVSPGQERVRRCWRGSSCMPA